MTDGDKAVWEEEQEDKSVESCGNRSFLTFFIKKNQCEMTWKMMVNVESISEAKKSF